jgi:putative membrane protein
VIEHLPALNATLNGTAAVLLATGWVFVRAGRIDAHRRCMIAAFVASSLFLTSYVVYHLNAGVKRYPGHGVLRAIYLSILIPHVILAAVVLPLAIITLTLALRRRFDRHPRVARWTLPIWLFVSVTGVVVYMMLYL